FTVLLALPHDRLRASDVSGDRRLVQPLTRVPDRRLAARVPRDLLLLPPLLLPRVLLVAARLHRAGRAREVQRRDALPIRPAEPESLHALPGDRGPRDPLVGRAPCLQLRWSF